MPVSRRPAPDRAAPSRPVLRWSAGSLGRSAARYLWRLLMRSLISLGAVATGVAMPGWWRTRADNWWEGVGTSEESGLRSVISDGRIEPGGLKDPAVLRDLRGLRGSQDLSGLEGSGGGSLADAAPHWHPERRADG
ncbi:hypothetical protein [Streptomyces sp. CA-111067]|jgi:hypothetical protein|uniref:hypothetical protein n=1 Tax=Streptomyces sp. CA-111067 TaxID=3240046 RepID=UPI003D95E653